MPLSSTKCEVLGAAWAALAAAATTSSEASAHRIDCASRRCRVLHKGSPHNGSRRAAAAAIVSRIKLVPLWQDQSTILRGAGISLHKRSAIAVVTKSYV